MSILSETGCFPATPGTDTMCCTSGQERHGMAEPIRTCTWLEALTSCDEFFRPCKHCSGEHSGRDNRVTYFDIVDSKALCGSCKDQHSGHKCLQVRRSSYHEVVKVSDISKLVDISSIQPYVINGEKVVFLRQRPQPRPPKGCVYPAKCGLCSRHLMDSSSSYCSLRCKLECEERGFGRQEVPKWVVRGKRTAPGLTLSAENPSADNSSYSYEDFGHLQSDLSGPTLRPARLSGERTTVYKQALRGAHRRKSTPARAPLQ